MVEPGALASFVGMPVDFHGVFASSSSFEEDLAFIEKLHEAEPVYAKALVRQGQELTRLASINGLRQIMAIVGRAKPRELLPYFTTKMFLAACFNGCVTVLRYMLQQGFDYTREPCKFLLHRVAEGDLEPKKKSGVLNALCRIGYRANAPAPPLGFTALHVAVAAGDIPTTVSLLSLSADANAVANRDVMPLTLAVAAAKAQGDPAFKSMHWQAKDACVPTDISMADLELPAVSSDSMVHLLVKAGAKLTWRASGALKRPATPPKVPVATAASMGVSTSFVSTGVSASAASAASGAGAAASAAGLMQAPLPQGLARHTGEGTAAAPARPSAGMLSLVEQYKRQKAQGGADAGAAGGGGRAPLSDSPMMLFSFGSTTNTSAAPRESAPAASPPPLVQEHADGSLTFSTE